MAAPISRKPADQGPLFAPNTVKSSVESLWGGDRPNTVTGFAARMLNMMSSFWRSSAGLVTQRSAVVALLLLFIWVMAKLKRKLGWIAELSCLRWFIEEWQKFLQLVYSTGYGRALR